MSYSAIAIDLERRWPLRHIAVDPLSPLDIRDQAAKLPVGVPFPATHAPRLCPRCGEALRVIVKLFDQNKGRAVRVYRCLSGHVVWDD